MRIYTPAEISDFTSQFDHNDQILIAGFPMNQERDRFVLREPVKNAVENVVVVNPVFGRGDRHQKVYDAAWNNQIVLVEGRVSWYFNGSIRAGDIIPCGKYDFGTAQGEKLEGILEVENGNYGVKGNDYVPLSEAACEFLDTLDEKKYLWWENVIAYGTQENRVFNPRSLEFRKLGVYFLRAPEGALSLVRDEGSLALALDGGELSVEDDS